MPQWIIDGFKSILDPLAGLPDYVRLALVVCGLIFLAASIFRKINWPSGAILIDLKPAEIFSCRIAAAIVLVIGLAPILNGARIERYEEISPDDNYVNSKTSVPVKDNPDFCSITRTVEPGKCYVYHRSTGWHFKSNDNAESCRATCIWLR